ncbi:TlyA family RNA methyltransferase [Egicoccus sp. AB-alg6-2]|uniref:TlyA family RNA methyltransferase n=1 Tax=Egicoccus sp. AB-alg6-2 TaxID=3242692 RepID=UPI00359DCD2D
MSPSRRRLDAELVRRGLTVSRTEAQEAIAAGLVTVDGAPALKSATQVHAGQAIVVAAPARRFVSRGGEKLAHALERFAVDPSGRRCLDAGVSTGGFTDCLLQAGAAHVLAYDVGYGQVHEKLRQHPQVTVQERTNVRDLTSDLLPPPLPDLMVADLSFISLAGVLPALRPLLADPAEAVVLVKPQFEAEREQVGKGGVVRDPDVWRQCLLRVADAARSLGWRRLDVTASPLLGPAGNVEFLMHLEAAGADEPGFDDVLAAAVAEGRAHRSGAGS